MKAYYGLALGLLALFVTRCKEEDQSHYFYDADLETIYGVWNVSGSSVCYSYDDQSYESYYDNGIEEIFFYFSEDDHCSIVKYTNHFKVLVEEYNYIFDGRSVSLTKDGLEVQKWVLKMNSYMAGGKRIEDLVFCDEGEENIIIRSMVEIRCDTTIAMYSPKLTQYLTVPKDRVWQGKNLVGYLSGSRLSEHRVVNRKCKKDKTFVECGRTKEEYFRRGTYELKECGDGVDSLYLYYSDGEVREEQVVFDVDKYYSYVNGVYDGNFWYGRGYGCPNL